MERARRFRPALPLAVIASLAGLCASCRTCASPALDDSPAELPEEWVYEVAIGSDAVLEAIRARLPAGDAVRVALPSGIADVADGLVGLPDPVRAQLAAQSPLRCIALREAAAHRRACAVRVRPLPPSIAAAPGAPRGARWLEELGDAVAIAGDAVVIGESRRTVERALPWLVFTALHEPDLAGVRVRFAEDVGVSAFRPIAESAIDRYARELRAAAAAERARHSEAPLLGEPEAIVDAAAASLRERAALLPDLGAIEISLVPTPAGLELLARAEVRAGSPLARRLALVPEGPAFGLAALPAGTVIAWTARANEAERAATTEAALEVLLPIAGERLGTAEHAVLRAALEAWAGARGEAALVAIGIEGAAPWALLASRPARNVALSPFELALRSSWASRIAEHAFGCRTARPSEIARPATGEPGSHTIYEGENLCGPLRIARASEEDVLAIGIDAAGFTRTAPVVGLVAERLASGTAELGAAADVERELAALPEKMLGAVLIVPARVPAFLAAFAPAQRGRAEPIEGRNAPIVISLSREPAGALIVRASASREALESLALLAGLVVDG